MHEECGVFGIWQKNGDCASNIYYALMALQHRGQEGCGIAVNENRETVCYKHMGLVNDIFTEDRLKSLNGNMGVGHCRYSAAAFNIAENVQPLVLRYVKGTLAIAHNGSLTNADELKKDFEKTGAIFQTTSATEVFAYMIARERLASGAIEKAVINAMKAVEGAYSMIIMSPQKLVAVRDPWGFRPLSIGRKGDTIMFASESCAFDALDARFERDILPGEVVVVDKDGTITSYTDNCKSSSHLCIFEHIYFARPDSVIDGQLVYEARKTAGKYLAIEHPVDADIVVGVPDSGIGAAIGYAKESNIPYENGFIKNRYIGRTFIQPKQEDRELAVRIKLNALQSTIEGKRVIMVDDSIVRGTTCKRIVKLLRDVGAKEVHVRISSPPFIYPCYYGTDIPSRDVLTAVTHTIPEINDLIGSDSLGYLSLESTRKIAPSSNAGFCDACFTGKYPVLPTKN